PTVVPKGKHVMSCFAQYVPYEFADGTWDTRRSEVSATITKAIERFAPGFEDLIEEVEVSGPPDIERKIGLTGGHIFQGECLPEFMWDRRVPYRSGVEGVYLCGAGTYPGGSVIAVNGRNAALCLLEDLG
ncbi:MAG TPA: NAD(P)/FAD-dependent oxidoreductase, partial [Acidimicrobiia bacterium]